MEKKGILKSFLRLFFSRKIQFDIITVFVVLISLSSIFIISFTYYKNSQEILKIARLTMEKASQSILQKVKNVTAGKEMLVSVTQSLVQQQADISLKNAELTQYMLDVLKFSHSTTAFRIANQQGDFLGVANLSYAKNFTGANRISHHGFPKEALYVLRSIAQGSNQAIWQYFDKDFQLVYQEQISPLIDNFQEELWFKQTQQIKKLHWSEKYTNLLGEGGVTIATTVDGNPSAVVAMNLSTNLLDEYFSQERVGSSGASFVIDQNGVVVVPKKNYQINSAQQELIDLIPDIYQTYKKNNRNDFIFESNEIKYLVYLSDFPVPLENPWKILFIVPINEFFYSILETQKLIIMISLIITFVFVVLVYFSSKHIGTPVVKLAEDVRRIQHFDFTDVAPLNSHIKEIIELESAVDSMRNAIGSFEKYIPKEIVKVLIKQGKKIAVGGEKKEVTVFFSDISDFTTFSESMPAEKLLDYLTQYFEVFSSEILKMEGTIDKYIGDCVMAMWNAPQTLFDHPERACTAALRCLKKSSQQQAEPGSPGWKTRFGLHIGEVIVGNIGTNDRMNYTVIGDVVNTTSRLHGVNKIFNTSIIISDTLQKRLGPQFLTRPLDTVSVKGKKNQITVYELVGLLQGDPELLASKEEVELCKRYEEAYHVFCSGDLLKAKDLFSSLELKFPQDKSIKIYLDKINALK
jgi:adenylate cyclase